MRISSEEINTIKKIAIFVFGEGTKVFLFGSRVDDQRKGGDIDLFITNKNKKRLTINSKINFLAELKTTIGDQKIDVVLDNLAFRKKKSFHKSINSQAIEL